MSGWKTVERKANKKVKKAARDSDDFTDSEDDYQFIRPNYGNGGALLSSYEGANKKPAPKREPPTLAQKAAAAAAHAEELEKRRQERKASAADAIRAKRREAQEHAKKANDATQWPTVAEALAEQSEPFMDHFDKIMDEDPIISKGGIGALLAYAPSIFEKFLHRTQLLPEEASGEVLLVDSVEGQAEDYPEALDTFVYYKSLLSKMPEIKDSKSEAVKDGLIALLSAVWGTKGLKNALAAKDTGRGATIAIELTFDQLWLQALANIKSIAAMFVNPSKGEPHGPLAEANFHRIFAIMTNAANNSKGDRDIGRIAIARAAADLLTSGYLTALFRDNTEDATSLLEVIAKALRYVSTKQLTHKAYHGINWKDATPYGEFITATKLEGAKLSDSWSIITLELLARQSPHLAKTTVGALLGALDKELADRASFSPADSVPVVVLSTIFALHSAVAIGPLKARASESPRAALVFLAVAKASKLFDVPAHLEEVVASAAKKAGAQAPKMNNNVKLADIPSSKPSGQQKKKTDGQATAGQEAEQEYKQQGSPKAYLITFVVLGIAAAAAYYFKQMQP